MFRCVEAGRGCTGMESDAGQFNEMCCLLLNFDLSKGRSAQLCRVAAEEPESDSAKGDDAVVCDVCGLVPEDGTTECCEGKFMACSKCCSDGVCKNCSGGGAQVERFDLRLLPLLSRNGRKMPANLMKTKEKT